MINLKYWNQLKWQFHNPSLFQASINISSNNNCCSQCSKVYNDKGNTKFIILLFKKTPRNINWNYFWFNIKDEGRGWMCGELIIIKIHICIAILIPTNCPLQTDLDRNQYCNWKMHCKINYICLVISLSGSFT